MPFHEFRLTALIQQLDERLYLGEPLFFGEVACLNRNLHGLEATLELAAKYILGHEDRQAFYRRSGRGEIHTRAVTLPLDPPERDPSWTHPLELTLPAVWWNHGEDACVAYLPALGIKVIAENAERLELLLPRHLKATLMRRKMLRLDRIVPLTRVTEVSLRSLTVTLKLPTPKQAALDAEDERGKREPIINQVGLDLTRQRLAEAYEVEDILPRLAEALTGRSPRSVLLVGPSGVGKTAVLHELVRRRDQFGLGNVPFWATSGARLVAGMSGFGMWQQRCQQLLREAGRDKAILHLGNLVELMEVGKSEYHQQGIASFLRPYLARGEVLAVAECTPEQVPLIERQEPHLLHQFALVPIEEPSRERGLAILTSQALALALRKPDDPLPIEQEALHALDRLHRRYATYSAYPGRPLRFLKNLFADRPQNQPVGKRDVTSAFSRETGLPVFLLEETVKLDLDHARRWFGERVIGQEEAVSLVTDLLATVKARLTRPRKPIASLMFIGPTGVGKTEMAKALAEYLFGSRTRLTRFDMSEYADPLAVQRLIGHGCTEGLLTARVREQPFSVVLLDEFEKADPQLFDLLLQVLGEGRLTDAQGRLADFCNTVVIMTSNLGAATFQQGAFGYGPAAGGDETRQRDQAREHFVREVQRFVRPEFFNRIDRVVPFSPLDEGTVLKIAHRQLGLVRLRDGVRFRGVQLDVSDEVAAWLARRGYEVRYGARPLKRAIDREMLAPLAERMNRYTADTPLRVAVALEQDRLAVEVRARTDEAGRALSEQGADTATIEHAGEAVELRRDLQRLQRSVPVLELVNEIFRLERLQKRMEQRRKVPHYEDLRGLERLDEHRRLRDDVERLHQDACRLEDDGLLRLYEQRPLAADFAGAVARKRREFEATLLQLYLRRFDRPDQVTVAVYSEQAERMLFLARTYLEIARQRGGGAEVWQILPPKGARERGAVLERRQVLNPVELFTGRSALTVRAWDAVKRDWASPNATTVPALEGVIGLVLAISAPAAYPFFVGEDGLHQFQGSRDPGRVLVDTSALPLTSKDERGFYLPPSGVERRGHIGSQGKRRLYQTDREEGQDFWLDRKFTWTGATFTAEVAAKMERRLVQAAQTALGPVP